MTALLKQRSVPVRRVKGSRRVANSKSLATFTKSIAPDDMFVTLKYGDAWDLSAGAVDYAANVFRLNSLFDPDLTGVGGQPSGFDYWATAYNRYKVISADIKVVFNNTTNTQSYGAVTVYGAGYTAPSSGTEVQQSCLEGDHTQHVVLSPTGVGNRYIRGVVQEHVDIKELLGKAAFDDAESSAAISASPTLLAYAQIAVAAWNGTTVGPAAIAVVQITFNTHFTQRRLLYED